MFCNPAPVSWTLWPLGCDYGSASCYISALQNGIGMFVKWTIFLILQVLNWEIIIEALLLGSSVQFSRSVVSDSLRPHESQYTRPPCPSPIPEFTQTHVHRVSDAIQPSHPLSSPSPPAPNPSQHQGLFQWVNSSHKVAKVLEFQLQHQSFQWTPRTDLL